MIAMGLFGKVKWLRLYDEPSLETIAKVARLLGNTVRMWLR